MEGACCATCAPTDLFTGEGARILAAPPLPPSSASAGPGEAPCGPSSEGAGGHSGELGELAQSSRGLQATASGWAPPPPSPPLPLTSPSSHLPSPHGPWRPRARPTAAGGPLLPPPLPLPSPSSPLPSPPGPWRPRARPTAAAPPLAPGSDGGPEGRPPSLPPAGAPAPPEEPPPRTPGPALRSEPRRPGHYGSRSPRGGLDTGAPLAAASTRGQCRSVRATEQRGSRVRFTEPTRGPPVRRGAPGHGDPAPPAGPGAPHDGSRRRVRTGSPQTPHLCADARERGLAAPGSARSPQDGCADRTEDPRALPGRRASNTPGPEAPPSRAVHTARP